MLKTTAADKFIAEQKLESELARERRDAAQGADMKKSVYRGHCQACGRLQMLPKGVLSKHGYNVAHGYFSGTCVGSAHLPFEQSCELVKRFIADATFQRDLLQRTCDDLRAPVTSSDALAWVRVYYSAEFLKKRHSAKEWEQVELRATRVNHHSGDGWYVVYSFIDARGRLHDGERNGVYGASRHDVLNEHGESTDDMEACRRLSVSRLNTTYAEWLQHEVTSLTRYIKWQTERVTTWKEAPLLPVDAKSKAGFVPTPAPY